MDFKKLAEKMKADRARRNNMTKEEQEKEDQEKFDQQYPYHSKVVKLHHYITDFPGGDAVKPNEWELGFIDGVYTKHVIYCRALSDKEKNKVDELVFQYLRRSAPEETTNQEDHNK